MNRAILLLSVAAFCPASAFRHFIDDSVSIVFENIGPSPLGVFYIGNETDRRMYNVDSSPPEQAPILDYEVRTSRSLISPRLFHFDFDLVMISKDFCESVKRSSRSSH